MSVWLPGRASAPPCGRMGRKGDPAGLAPIYPDAGLGQGPWLGLLGDTGVHRFRSSNGGAVLDEGPQPRVQTGVPGGRQLPRARAQR